MFCCINILKRSVYIEMLVKGSSKLVFYWVMIERISHYSQGWQGKTFQPFPQVFPGKTYKSGKNSVNPWKNLPSREVLQTSSEIPKQARRYGGCRFSLLTSMGGRIDHFCPFLPNFAPFLKYFKAKIAPKGGTVAPLGPPYLRPCQNVNLTFNRYHSKVFK